MASAWITTRRTAGERTRYRVMYRLGGRESAPRYAGSFASKREALARKAWVLGELAAMRVPDVELAAPRIVPTLGDAADRWRATRVDVSEGTMQTYRVALGRLLSRFGGTPVDELDAQTVADLVAELHAAGLRKQTIRKTVSVLAMILDHAAIQPNPARDKQTIRLPREERRHVEPPAAEHVEAVVRLLPGRYRLPALVLDATGMRVGELERLTWGDVDEPRGRWRVSTAVAKTGRARWIEAPSVLFEAVCALVAREDRVPDRPVFQGFGADRFRTALTRACTAAGVPTFSPHDLRHRRVSLLHLGGMPWARIGELVGHDDLVTTARTYTHVVVDERELDYAELLG
ncbi:MAG: tyrosine-type recombinase/integrase [Gaiellaceae bacterium]